MSHNNNEDAYRNLVRRTKPARLDDFWLRKDEEAENWGTNPRMASLIHYPAQSLSMAFSDDEIAELLRDTGRLKKLVTETAKACLHLGMLSEQLKEQVYEGHDVVVVSTCCFGCNTPYDQSGTCDHQRSSSRPILIPLNGSSEWHRVVQQHLHRACTLLSVVGNLLTRDDCYELVQLMVPEQPPGMSVAVFLQQEMMRTIASDDALAGTGENGGVCLCASQIFALVDNASRLFPKAAQYAAACLSLVASRAPGRTLALMDVKVLCETVNAYIADLFELIHNNECIFEEAWGTIAYINIVPLLYWLGDWEAAHPWILKSTLPELVSSVAINILHSVWIGQDDERVDRAFDYETFPELRPAVNFMYHLEGDGREHPLSWAVAASFEVLGRWTMRGIPVSSQTCSTNLGREPITTLYKEYTDRCNGMGSEKARRVTEDILLKLSRRETPGLPSMGESILRKPMEDMLKRCACCGSEGGRKFSCGGDCKGLACYCCKEHQVKHWKIHKDFCKRAAKK